MFGHDQIFIENDSRHFIVPVDSMKDFVEIYVDLGNDGTIDDTL